jgi:predicted transcriptional regulator
MRGVTLVAPFIFQLLRLFMSTTSLKLPDDIKQKATTAAVDLGITPHAFMVEDIRKAALAAEKQATFISDAQAARAAALESGLGYAAHEVHQHLRDRINEKKAAVNKKKTIVHSKLTAKPWRV